MPHPYWPLFDLVVRTPMLELRYPTDDDVVALAAVGSRGIHDSSWMPLGGWSDAESPDLERGILAFQWKARAEWSPTSWSFNPVVVVDGEVVGTQGMGATEFPKLRSVGTGSWIGMEHQGRGIGKEMRAAMLHLAFEGLGAVEALSGYWHDNEPSRRISDGLGYQWNGEERTLRRGEPDTQVKVRLTRRDWGERRRDDIVIENLEPCLELFGAAPDHDTDDDPS
ncbi:MAG: GNAT family N-acetyltransferase [Acidimicrobiales bacterium]